MLKNGYIVLCRLKARENLAFFWYRFAYYSYLFLISLILKKSDSTPATENPCEAETKAEDRNRILFTTEIMLSTGIFEYL